MHRNRRIAVARVYVSASCVIIATPIGLAAYCRRACQYFLPAFAWFGNAMQYTSWVQLPWIKHHEASQDRCLTPGTSPVCCVTRTETRTRKPASAISHLPHLSACGGTWVQRGIWVRHTVKHTCFSSIPRSPLVILRQYNDAGCRLYAWPLISRYASA